MWCCVVLAKMKKQPMWEGWWLKTSAAAAAVAAVVVVVVVVVAGWGLGKEPETKRCQQSFIFNVSLAVSVHIGQSMPLYRFFNI